MSNWLVDKLIPSIMRSEVKKSSVPEGDRVRAFVCKVRAAV